MTLEPKHIAPYLPYNLRCHIEGHFWNPEYFTVASLHTSDNSVGVLATKSGGTLRDNAFIPQIRPILRPLSDLTKEIEYKGGQMVAAKYIKKIHSNVPNFDYLMENFDYWVDENWEDSIVEFCIAQTLFEWHFDVFNLIPAGLAVELKSVAV